jgi:hypothetical protein
MLQRNRGASSAEPSGSRRGRCILVGVSAGAVPRSGCFVHRRLVAAALSGEIMLAGGSIMGFGRAVVRFRVSLVCSADVGLSGAQSSGQLLASAGDLFRSFAARCRVHVIALPGALMILRTADPDKVIERGSTRANGCG